MRFVAGWFFHYLKKPMVKIFVLKGEIMKKVKAGLSVILTASIAIMVPIPAIADTADSAVQSEVAMLSDLDSARATEIQGFVSSSLKAGAAMGALEKETSGAVSIDFENLPNPAVDEAWLADAEKYLDDLLVSAPATYSVDDATMDAQAGAVAWAYDRAAWSYQKGRTSDLESEATYMYMSHYIDIGSNYWNAGGLDYLTSGAARSNTQPFLSQWLLPADRDAYKTYINTTSGTKQLAKVGGMAINIKNLVDEGKDLASAATNLDRTAAAAKRSSAVLAVINAGYDGVKVTGDLKSLWAQMQIDFETRPGMTITELSNEYLESSEALSGYDEMARDSMLEIVFGAAASACLSGVAVAAVGAAAIGLVGAAATISLYMASDIYSYVAWAGMRYGWSTRYSMRLYEQLFG